MMRVGKPARRILLLIFFFSLFSMLVATRSENVAEIINQRVCIFARKFINKLSSLLPFSLFELIVLSSPIIIFLAIRYVVNGDASARKRFFKLISCFTVIPSLFFLTVGIPAQRYPIARAVEYAPSYDELTLCAQRLIDEANLQVPSADFDISVEDMRGELQASYSEISPRFNLRVKQLPMPKILLLPKLASRLGILGHYSFLTGEVNINTDVPRYMIPFTLAHEYAHYLGVSSEAEAGFLAFAVCMNSDVDYIKYSGVLSTLEYFLSDIYSCDRAEYERLYSSLLEPTRVHLKESYEYLSKYSGTRIYRIADGINSSYIDAFDKNGGYSYSAICRYVTQYLLYS